MNDPITEEQTDQLRSMAIIAFSAFIKKAMSSEYQKKLSILLHGGTLTRISLSILVDMVKALSDKYKSVNMLDKKAYISKEIQQEYMDIIGKHCMLALAIKFFPEILTTFTEEDFTIFLPLMVPPSQVTSYHESDNSKHQSTGHATSNIGLFEDLHSAIVGPELARFFQGANVNVFSAYHGNGIATKAILFSITSAKGNITGMYANDTTVYDADQTAPAPFILFQCSFDNMSQDEFGLLAEGGSNTIVVILGDCLPNTDGHDLRGTSTAIDILSKLSQNVIFIIFGEIGAGSFSEYYLAFIMNHPLVRVLTHQYSYQSEHCASSRSFLILEILKRGRDYCFDYRQLMTPNKQNLSMLDPRDLSSLPYCSARSTSEALKLMQISHTSIDEVTAFESSNTHCMQVVHKCNICLVVSKLFCSACKGVYYCCSTHQKQDWKMHKKVCKPKA